MIAGIYILFILGVTGAGFLVKDYALSMTTILFNDREAVVSVAPLKLDRIQRSLKMVNNNSRVKEILSRLKLPRRLIYVLPEEWGIPELGIKRKGASQNYLLHPETHGNSLTFNPDHLTVLVTAPILPSNCTKGKDILKRSINFIPFLEVTVDLKKGEVKHILERVNKGRWDGIPVPIY